MNSILGRKVITFLNDILSKAEGEKKKQQYADCIIRNDKGEILLLQRATSDDFQPEKWCLPGGKIEPGEDPQTAASRELQEETGIDIDVAPITTIEKEDCVIHYHEGFANSVEILDNDEHYRSAFVPVSELGGYDLILDLGDVLQKLIPQLSLNTVGEFTEYSNIEEEIAMQPESETFLDPALINKAFDAGEISEDDWLTHETRKGAFEVIKKGYDQGLVTNEQFFGLLEKAKHHEFVQVTRDNKTFYQYREVGTDKVEEDIETGDTLDTKDLGLNIKKYSDKSFLVTGETLKNLDLLRKIKQEIGFGAWNKGLNGWIFPLSGKDKMMAVLASKMPVDTYDEQIKKDAAIALKNAVDTGTEVSFDDLYRGFDDLYSFVDEVTTNEEGKVEYTVVTEPKKEEEVKPEETPAPEVETMNFTQFAVKNGYPSDYDILEHGGLGSSGYESKRSKDFRMQTHLERLEANKKAHEEFNKLIAEGKIIDSEGKITKEKLNQWKYDKESKEIQTKIDAIDSGIRTIEGLGKMSHLPNGKLKIGYQRAVDDYNEKKKKLLEQLDALKGETKPTPVPEEKKEEELPIGTLSPDGTKIKTANGWEAVKKTVTEEEIAIVPADEKKAEELINNANEENRFKVAKQLFGKEAGEKPVSNEIEQEGQKEVKIEVREFTTRGGVKLQALDYTGVKQMDIQLIDQAGILEKKKPYWIPEVNEKMFERQSFTFNYIKQDDGHLLLAINNQVRYDGISSSSSYPADYAVVTPEQFVAVQDYFRKKKKAELEQKNLDYLKTAVKKIKDWDEKRMEYYKPFDYENLSKDQKKKYPKEKWEALSTDEKIDEVPFMKNQPFKGYSTRISVLKDDRIPNSYFSMYNNLVDAYDKGINGRYLNMKANSVIEYNEIRQILGYKLIDLNTQKEENDSSYVKGRETSYGDSNTKDDLLESHGVKVKRQNGDEINEKEIGDIREALDEVFSSFGDRKEMARNWGLKISHSADKLMHARKAAGLFVPSMRAIGVSYNREFGFTLAHEYAHFIDNYVGKQKGRHYASDDYESLAGKIAKTFRTNMNKKTDSDYFNRTCECFARALEQYHAMKRDGDDAIIWREDKYHENENHVSKEKFNTLVKPLIEQFLSENDHLMKSAHENLTIIGEDKVAASFDLIKSAFDAGQINEDTFLEYQEKYELIKGDPSHGGKLVKKTMMNKMGKKETVWVKRNGEEPEEKEHSKPKEPVPHSKGVLSAYAKETAEKELKRAVAEHHDPAVRKAAHEELARRDKHEKPQEKEDKKPVAKKKDKVEPKKEEKSKLAEKKEEVEDGKAKPVKIKPNETFSGKLTLLKNTEKAPNLGARFGQDVEPVGFYCIQKESDHLDDHPNYKTLTIDIKKPLIIDTTEDLVQWKRDLAAKYKAKGKGLSAKLVKEGYDSIITTDKHGYTGEIIILDTNKLNEIDVKKKK